jgi:hypothetical protein
LQVYAILTLLGGGCQCEMHLKKISLLSRRNVRRSATLRFSGQLFDLCFEFGNFIFLLADKASQFLDFVIEVIRRPHRLRAVDTPEEDNQHGDSKTTTNGNQTQEPKHYFQRTQTEQSEHLRTCGEEETQTPRYF